MSNQKRTRDEAFGVVIEALDLAQNLSYLSDYCNPQYLKISARLSRKRLLKIIMDNHEVNVKNTELAYGLVETIGEWADEYSLIERKTDEENG